MIDERDLEDDLERVSKFYCEHCHDYFELAELDVEDCSHWEQYHGHPVLIDDYCSCCPQCGGEVCEKFVEGEDE